MKACDQRMKLRNGRNRSCLLFFCFVLIGCSSQHSDIQSFYQVPSIVVGERNDLIIKNNYSDFFVNGWDSIPRGTCGLASYTVDYMDQLRTPPPPFRAVLTAWETLPLSSFQFMSGSIDDAYKDTIYAMSPVSLLDQFLFLAVEKKTNINNVFQYELLCNQDSVDEKEIMTMYLKAQITDHSQDTSRVITNTLVTFDIFEFIRDQSMQGKDTLRFNLKYPVRTDTLGHLIYSSYSKNPITIIYQE